MTYLATLTKRPVRYTIWQICQADVGAVRQKWERLGAVTTQNQLANRLLMTVAGDGGELSSEIGLMH